MNENFPIQKRIEVRWGDMDAMGHVNNATYFTYFESSRIEYFHAVDLYSAGEETHGPALAHAECNFRQQVHYPATIIVNARCAKIGTKSIRFEHVLTLEPDGHVVADGCGIIVWIDYATGKSIPVPEDLRKRFEDFEGKPIPRD